MNQKIQQIVNAYLKPQQTAFLKLRDLVLDTAKGIPEVGVVEETLKWNQPTFSTRTGSPIRIDVPRGSMDQIAFYFICTTNLVDQFKEYYIDHFEFEGNRAIILKIDEPMDEPALRHCIALALTHKLKKQ